MKRYMLTIGLVACSLAASAENIFEAGFHGGTAAFDAHCRYVVPVPNLHTGIQACYIYHSKYITGLRTGVTIDLHKAGFGKTNYYDSYTTIDVENAAMQVDYNIGILQECHTVWSAGIIIQLALNFRHFNIYFGPKTVFPFISSWQQTAYNASLSVYYPQQDNRVYESRPLAASRSFIEAQGGTKIRNGMKWWLSLEVCYDITLHTARLYRSYISIGLYAGYSITEQTDNASSMPSLLMLSDTRDGFPLHRIMTSVTTAKRQNLKLVENSNLYDVGIKIAYRFAPYNTLRQNTKNCRCDGVY